MKDMNLTALCISWCFSKFKNHRICSSICPINFIIICTHTRNLMVGAPSPANLTEVSCAPAMPCHGTLTTWKPKNQSTKKTRQHIGWWTTLLHHFVSQNSASNETFYISICPFLNIIDTLNQLNMWRGFGSTINTVPYPPPTFHPTSTLPCGSRKPPPACISWNSATRTWMPPRP